MQLLRNGMCTFEEECLIDIFRIDGWYKIDAACGKQEKDDPEPCLTQVMDGYILPPPAVQTKDKLNLPVCPFQLYVWANPDF